MARPLRAGAVLGTVLGALACATPGRGTPGGARPTAARRAADPQRVLFQPLPHLGAVAAGRYGLYRDDRRVAADSFWLYRGRDGGFVLSLARQGPGLRAEVWLAVDARFRPTAGWIREERGGARCATALAVRDSVAQLTRFDGPDARALQLRLAAPAAFGVRWGSPVFAAWGLAPVLAAADSELAGLAAPGAGGAAGIGPARAVVAELESPPCGAPSVDGAGFRPARVEGLRPGAWQVGGLSRTTWVVRRALDEPEARAGVDSLWVDAATGLAAAWRAGRERATLEWLWTSAP